MTPPKSSPTRFIVPALALGLVGFLAYGLLTPDPQERSALIGKPAPEFALKDLKGGQHRLEQYRGRPVVLNFWASYCVPCRSEAPLFAQLAAEQPGVQFLGVLYNDAPEFAQKFMDEYRLKYPALLDPDSRVAMQYGVGKIPVTFVLDKAGKIVYWRNGEVDQSQLEGFKAALAQAGR